MLSSMDQIRHASGKVCAENIPHARDLFPTNPAVVSPVDPYLVYVYGATGWCEIRGNELQALNFHIDIYPTIWVQERASLQNNESLTGPFATITST